MPRPTRLTVDNGTNAWDALMNSNFQNIYDRPLGMALHTGDETDIEATFAAASYDKCFIWIDVVATGWELWFSNGTVWAKFEPGGAGGGGGGAMTVQAISAVGTADSDENLLAVCTGTTYTVTLPSAATVGSGHRTTVKRKSSGTITLDGASADTIDGAATFDLDASDMAVSLVSDGTSNWHIV